MPPSGWFRRRSGEGGSSDSRAPEPPEGLMTKCLSPKCERILFKRDLEKNLRVCPHCSHHFRLSAPERLEVMADPDSFEEWDATLLADDPLEFPGYRDTLARHRRNTGLDDAVLTGRAAIGGIPVALGITDPRFIMGSMNSVVGERITRAIERAIEGRLPLILVSGTGGGARMHEGILSLMQMPKTAAALGRLDRAGLLYISLLTDPSMAGVYASWASLGDIVLAEPGAMVGFAGDRVAKQAQVGRKPADYQTSEFQYQHGMVDLVVPRKELKPTLERILRWAS